MASNDSLPTQIDFGFLSVPELQHVTLAHDVMECTDAFSRSGSSSSVKSTRLEQDVHVQVNCTSREVNVPLATAEIMAVRHAGALDVGSGGSGLEATDRYSTLSTLHILLDEIYDPERSFAHIAPPKRFFRTFWKSVSLRLLRLQADRADSAPGLPSKSDSAPIHPGR
jgi:hypothetical protein